MARKAFEAAAGARILVGGNGWQERHHKALRFPVNYEVVIVGMFKAWYEYAVLHELRFDSMIGDDYILGKAWSEIGSQLRVLLNGECGRLDCGTLDAFVFNTMKDHNVDMDTDGTPLWEDK